MSYANTTELIAALNLLLEAERAGARFARATRRASDDPAQAAFFKDLEKDEAHWCGVLKSAVERLGGVASDQCGPFFEKAMAIPDRISRLEFLNRGQSWVVRKLKEMMPFVQDEALLTSLGDMERNHLHNIAVTEALVEKLRA